MDDQLKKPVKSGCWPLCWLLIVDCWQVKCTRHFSGQQPWYWVPASLLATPHFKPDLRSEDHNIFYKVFAICRFKVKKPSNTVSHPFHFFIHCKYNINICFVICGGGDPTLPPELHTSLQCKIIIYIKFYLCALFV